MAAYTQLTPEEVRDLVSQFPVGTITKISPQDGGQANSSYRIRTERGRFILSVCDEKSSDEVQTLIRVLADLNRHNFPTSTPVAMENGKYLLSHQGKPVYLKEFIPGDVVRDLTLPMIEEIGRAMGQLHGVPVPQGIAPKFPYGFDAFDQYLVAPLDHKFTTWLKDQIQYLKETMDTGMAKGLIHGDIFWDNLVFEGEGLKAVLDFEEACQYYFLFDLGMAAVGCCSRDGRFDADQVRALIQGYESTRPLSETERTQFPAFLIYAVVAGAFWRFCQYNIHHPSEDKKDYYRELADLADQVRNGTLAV